MKREIERILWVSAAFASFAMAGNVEIVNTRDAEAPPCEVTVSHGGKRTRLEVAAGATSGSFSTGDGKVEVEVKTDASKASTSWQSESAKVVVVSGNGGEVALGSWDAVAPGEEQHQVQAVNLTEKPVALKFGKKEVELAPGKATACGAFGPGGVTLRAGKRELLTIQREEPCGVTVVVWRDGKGELRAIGVNHY